MPIRTLAEVGPLPAYLNHGAWVADCPLCKSAERVLIGQRQFRCRACGFMADITFPPEWADIMRAVMVRPKLENRNWLVGETVDDLLAENIEHGIDGNGMDST